MCAGCASKTVRSPETRAIPEHLRGVITTRRYTNPRLPYLTLPAQVSESTLPLISSLFMTLNICTCYSCTQWWKCWREVCHYKEFTSHHSFVPDMTYNVFGGTLNLAQSITTDIQKLVTRVLRLLK